MVDTVVVLSAYCCSNWNIVRCAVSTSRNVPSPCTYAAGEAKCLARLIDRLGQLVAPQLFGGIRRQRVVHVVEGLQHHLLVLHRGLLLLRFAQIQRVF